MLVAVIIGIVVFGVGIALAYFYGGAVGAGLGVKEIKDLIGDEAFSEIEKKANETDSEIANKVKSTLRLVETLDKSKKY